MKTANETVGTGKPTELKSKKKFTHIGLKSIVAKPMTRGEHSISKGFDKVLTGTPEDEGYQVIYEDGYESWSPKNVFEEAYKENGKLSFGSAVEFGLKRGNLISRKGWNGKGLFVFMQVPSQVSMAIVPKMTSLPESVKTLLNLRFHNNNSHCEEHNVDPIEMNSIKYSSQLALLKPDNTINSWSPSTPDALAEDWIIS